MSKILILFSVPKMEQFNFSLTKGRIMFIMEVTGDIMLIMEARNKLLVPSPIRHCKFIIRIFPVQTPLN